MAEAGLDGRGRKAGGRKRRLRLLDDALALLRGRALDEDAVLNCFIAWVHTSFGSLLARFLYLRLVPSTSSRSQGGISRLFSVMWAFKFRSSLTAGVSPCSARRAFDAKAYASKKTLHWRQAVSSGFLPSAREAAPNAACLWSHSPSSACV